MQELYKKKIRQRLCKWDERIVLDILREEANRGIYILKKKKKRDKIRTASYQSI